MASILSFIVAFGVCVIAGQILIPLLRRWKAGQSIREDGPTWHMAKQGTPTMGGLMFILAIGAALLAAGWEELQQEVYTHLFVFCFALVFGIIGFVDDMQKLRHHANEGLTAAQKFLLQLAASILFTVLLRNYGYLTPNLYIPFLNIELLGIPWPVYMVFAAFVMVATVNAVNLTDGIDGLATGVTIPVALFYVAIAAWSGRSEITVFSAALTGGGIVRLFDLQFPPGQSIYGGHRIPVPGRGGVRAGLCPESAPGHPHYRLCLRGGNPV